MERFVNQGDRFIKKKTTWASSFLIATCLSLASMSSATDLPQYLNFDGVLLDSSGNALVGSPTVMFDIYNPAANCLLYRESRTINLTAADGGEFSVKVGPGASGSTPSSLDGDISWYTIFQNSATLRGSGSTNCTPGYTPAAGDSRLLRVTVDGVALVPDFVLAPVPMASVAQTLQGRVPNDFLPASPASGVAVLNADLRVDNANQVLLGNTGSPSTQFVGLQAPAGLSTSYNLTLPLNAGIANQVLATDGAGVLSWITPSGGSGITSLNGSTDAAQTFATGSTGNAPTWSTAAGVHTLNIPSASAGAGVTAGLISNAEYNTFITKWGSVADIPDNTLTGNKLAASTITDSHLASGINASKITTGTLPLGVVPPPANNTIISSHILDGTIATVDIANNAVTDDKINSVAFSKLTGLACAPGQNVAWNGSAWTCGNSLVTGTSAGMAMDAGAVPNCGPYHKLEMSIGPTYTWSCAPIDGVRPTTNAATTSTSVTYSLTPGGNTGFFWPAGDDIGVSSNGVEIARFTQAGRLGIGTTIPATALHVRGDVSISRDSTPARLLLKAYGSSNVPVLQFVRAQGSESAPTYPAASQSLGKILFSGNNPTEGASISSNSTEAHSISAAGADLAFFTVPNGTSTATQVMKITSQGDVGIRTSNPVATLDINGFMRLQPMPTAPVGVQQGTIAYNSTLNAICYYNGTSWMQMNGTACTGW